MTGFREADALREPIRSLDRGGSTFDWDSNTSLVLSERYRARQLPLLRAGPRPTVGPEDLAPGEFWPSVRSAVLPVPDSIMGNRLLAGFLADLAASSAGSTVWFDGLRARAGRVHATLVSGIDLTGRSPEYLRQTSTCSSDGVDVVVHGPWIGHWNSGRIYLPLSAADDRSERVIRDARRRWGGQEGVLLAGFLQLERDVTDEAYAALRELISRYREAVRITVHVPELAIMETMDDLVLRSQVVARQPFPEEPDSPR